MLMINLIEKKRRGKEALTYAELSFICTGLKQKTIPDYQISAWAMAVFFNGMDEEELYHFTKAMLESGTVFNLKENVSGITVDKHSTGGVGDKLSLVLGPVLAAFGLKFCKISGRGLGISGGTIDKLEAIPGFQTNLTESQFYHVVNTAGLSIIAQNADVVPADKALYAIRDVSGTVPSLPLIAASIMSKKIAIGADIIVLDVKCGKGAFCETVDVARTLAMLMVNIGRKFNKHVIVVISDMEQPLGAAVGNLWEIQEAIALLSDTGPQDLKTLLQTVVSLIISKTPLATQYATRAQLEAALTHIFTTKSALAHFYQFITAQGGDVPSLAASIAALPTRTTTYEIAATTSGYLNIIDNHKLGELSVLLGGGKRTLTDVIDHYAGIVMQKKHGDLVQKDEIIMTLYTNNPFEEAFQTLAIASYQIDDQQPVIRPLILDILQ